MSSPQDHVVVTGMGAIAPLGSTCAEIFDNLLAGKSGIDRITQFDASTHRCQIAGEVRGFDPHRYMERKLANRIGRYAQFAIAAATEGLCQAGLDLALEQPGRVATVVGSAIADFPLLEDQFRLYYNEGPGKVSPFTVSRVSTNMAAGNVSLFFGTTGPSFGTASACATGSHALAVAWMLLRSGLADVAVAGGTDAAITPCVLESYVAMGALSLRNDDPPRASRPFDKNRDGFVLSEGCGVLILETLAHANKRGAPILAELAGVGMTSDAYHPTASDPRGQGASNAISLALRSAAVEADDVSYINAHGTSTQMNDPVETQAIKRSFGDAAYRIPVSSIKSMIGHSIGAAGALEAITCVMALQRGWIPPTINLEEPDESCDLDYVPLRARTKTLSVAVSNSFGFGGQNCVLVFRRP